MATITSRQKSYLELARGVDAVPYEPQAYNDFFRDYYKFKISDYPCTFGYVPKKAIVSFDWPKDWIVDKDQASINLMGGSNVEERSEVLSQTFDALSRSRMVPNLDRPKGELLPVYGPDSEHILDIDRAAAVFFGIVSYGIQMLAYVRTEHGIKYWVPRRAKSNRSYPGMLDNCVGGALDSGETPLTCLAREAGEEASLPEDYVREHAKPFGVVSYHMATNGNGEEGHQPQIMHVYHIELALEVVPTPSDGEVEKFELMTLDEVQTSLRNGEFKTNCAATWLSYLIVNGIINDENEPDLYRIQTHLHRRLQFPTK